MTQLGEAVALGLVDEAKVDCPFHDKQHQCDGAKNELAGDASTLGKALVDGSDATSTVVRKVVPDTWHKRRLRQEDDPDELPLAKREVQLRRGDDATWYPLGYQAHHLIPAKESLARSSKLLNFVRAGKKACCALGYDVNGNQNGVWLPGKHPVDGNGLDLWKGRSSPLADSEGKGRKQISRGGGGDKWSYVLLRGLNAGAPGAFDESNMRWLYVRAAMRGKGLGIRQFHDRHPTYSKAVLEHLDALAALLEKFAGTRKKPAGCADCKKTKEGQRQPPVALLGALNGLSSHYRRKVVGRTEDPVFYTSSWCDPARRTPGRAPKKKPKAVKRK